MILKHDGSGSVTCLDYCGAPKPSFANATQLTCGAELIRSHLALGLQWKPFGPVKCSLPIWAAAYVQHNGGFSACRTLRHGSGCT